MSVNGADYIECWSLMVLGCKGFELDAVSIM